MPRHAAFLPFLAACSLFFAGTAYATGPAARASRPAPLRATAAVRKPVALVRKPVAPAPRPVALAPAPAVAVAAPQPEAAPRMVSVSGTIVGATGQPCPGVSVFPTFNPRLIAVTDAKGAFHLQLPAAAGTFQLQADYFGVGSSRIAVDSQHLQAITMVLGQ